MAVEFIIAPEVEQDLAEAYAWYEARRAGLGEEFLSCVDAGIVAICRMPEMYAAVHFPSSPSCVSETGRSTVIQYGQEEDHD